MHGLYNHFKPSSFLQRPLSFLAKIVRDRLRIGLLFALVIALVGALYAQNMLAHGSFRVPQSREYLCFLEGPENPQSEACKAAIAHSGTSQFYN